MGRWSAPSSSVIQAARGRQRPRSDESHGGGARHSKSRPARFLESRQEARRLLRRKGGWARTVGQTGVLPVFNPCQTPAKSLTVRMGLAMKSAGIAPRFRLVSREGVRLARVAPGIRRPRGQGTRSTSSSHPLSVVSAREPRRAEVVASFAAAASLTTRRRRRCNQLQQPRG